MYLRNQEIGFRWLIISILLIDLRFLYRGFAEADRPKIRSYE